MIIQMRKMDLLLYHKEQGKFLEELRNLGVVHITSDAERPVDSTACQELKASVHLSNRVIAALNKVKAEKVKAGKEIPASGAHHGQPFEVIREFEIDESKKDRIGQEIASLVKDRETLLPWGNFQPESVARLSDVGLTMKFYTAPAKKFDSLDKSKLGVEKISEQGGIVYFVVVFRGDAPEVAADEVRLPEFSLKSLDEKIAALEKEKTEIDSKIEKLVGSIADIEKFRDEHLSKLKYEEARLSMKEAAEGKLLKLSGWVPQKNEADVVKFVNQHSAYAAFRDPLEDEAVPVRLKNNKFSKLFEPVFGIYSLPNYSEVDYTLFAAPFFAIFFGLCLGDAGYGFMVTLISAIAMLKVSAKMKPIMTLGLVLGFSTMIAGVLTDSFFGVSLLSKIGLEKLAPLAPVEGAGETVYPTMGLAILAGFIQVFLGMFIQSYMQMKSRGFTAGLQPIACIIMVTGLIILGAHSKFMDLGIETFSVGALQIGPHLVSVPSAVAKGLTYGGLAMLLLFNNVDKVIFMRPLTGLWALYNFASGFISNVLSYLRLFALGLAGGLLGGAVNQIAFLFITNQETGEVTYGSVWIVGTILVLIGGHIVNLGFSALAAFIHPLRLTFVEFYSAVGFKGGSRPYVPFANVKQQ